MAEVARTIERLQHLVRRILVACIVSFVASLIAAGIGQWRMAFWLSAPALLFASWRWIGHIVTLDDDAPGRWSNPWKSAELWRASLRELAWKSVAFLVVGATALWYWIESVSALG